MSPPRVLVIAGSDSSGGAGLEADQKVLSAHGVYAQTVTTALTAQNTLGVTDVHITPTSFLAKQIDACLSDIGCDVVKIGMLASAATVQTVADKLTEWSTNGDSGAGRVVLDPVMVSTSGAQLLPGDAVRGMLDRLVKDVEVVTPNIPEAILMLKEGGDDDDIRSPTDLEGLRSLVKTFHTKLKPRAVLLKGGHVPLISNGEKLVKADPEQNQDLVVVDILFDGKDFEEISSKYIRSRNTHGTGCSLASAIAANLAKGRSLKQSVRYAQRYVAAGIETSVSFSKGSGPINHFHNVQLMPFAQNHFLDYLLSREDVRPTWDNYVCHPFAEKMGDGSLPVDEFKDYLIQDYLYLTHFARTNALAAYKSTDMDAITASAQIVLHIEREMQLHLEYCKDFGLTKEEILKRKESLACTAYSRYVLDIGQSQDWLALQMSLAPCLLGYGEAAEMLKRKYQSRSEGNKYWKWIENYTATDYLEAIKIGRGEWF